MRRCAYSVGVCPQLETNMTSLALDSLARQLNSTAHSLQQPLFAAEARSLLQAAGALSALLQDVLQPMLQDSAALNTTAARLRDSLRFNHSSLKEAIAYLMHETTEAEVFLNTQGPDRLQNVSAHTYTSTYNTLYFTCSKCTTHIY